MLRGTILKICVLTAEDAGRGLLETPPSNIWMTPNLSWVLVLEMSENLNPKRGRRWDDKEQRMQETGVSGYASTY